MSTVVKGQLYRDLAPDMKPRDRRMRVIEVGSRTRSWSSSTIWVANPVRRLAPVLPGSALAPSSYWKIRSMPTRCTWLYWRPSAQFTVPVPLRPTTPEPRIEWPSPSRRSRRTRQTLAGSDLHPFHVPACHVQEKRTARGHFAVGILLALVRASR